MYRLRFPFRPVHEVTEFENAIPLRADRAASMAPHLPYVILNLDDYPSEAAAVEALPRAYGTVMVASLIAGQGFQVETDLDRVHYPADPQKAAAGVFGPTHKRARAPVDAIANGNFPAVIPSNKNVVYVTAGEVTVRQSMPATRLSPHLERALSFTGLEVAFSSDRLRIAFDLWTDYHRERSSRAKFLTLVIALEVLARPKDKHERALTVLHRWEGELREMLEGCPSGSDEYEALESLGRELVFRRERSIRSRVRAHVLDVIGQREPDRAATIAALAVRSYDLRSSLIHEGTLSSTELEQGHAAARQAVRAVLLASVGIPPSSVGA